MTATLSGGPLVKELTRDSEGHRDYKVIHLVKTAAEDGSYTADGPTVVMNTPGLPIIGALWNFGNDSDLWAFCHPDMKVSVHQAKKGEPPQYWTVEQKFSTRPLNRCQDETIEDPLLEPQKVSGSFVKYTEEAFKDRFGQLILSSSFEQFHGPQVEFDANRPTVRVEQNVAALGLATFASMVDTVNYSMLWGLGRRKIKLSNVSWERKLYGVCNYYYTRVFDFDINFKTFDRQVPDQGTKVLNGQWNSETGNWNLIKIAGRLPSKDNPADFCRYKDRFGENARVILDGKGLPANSIVSLGTGEATGTGTEETVAAQMDLEYYDESNFLVLGIPTSF